MNMANRTYSKKNLNARYGKTKPAYTSPMTDYIIQLAGHPHLHSARAETGKAVVLTLRF